MGELVKPFSEACERNKQPILQVLEVEFATAERVLELGSGTGQHAVFFAGALPHLQWQTSDLPVNHEGIRQWIADEGPGNVFPPITLDVREEWPQQTWDGVFSANTVHIMSWEAVVSLFGKLGQVLVPGGRFVLYGPFKYSGRYTSDSNAAFDQWLKARDPSSGIRDFEQVDALARENGLRLRADHEMPANNRILVWERTGRSIDGSGS